MTWSAVAEHDRRSFLRASGLAALGVAAGAGLVTACSDDDSAALDDDNLGFAGTVLGYPVAKPTIAFTDTSGAPYDVAAETAGKLTLMLFGYTSCPDVCPVHLSILADTLADLTGPASKTNVIFVGVDTQRDTPEVMRTYLDKRNPDFVGLSADPAQLDEALAAMQLPSIIIGEPREDGSYVVEHPSQILAFTPDNECHIVYPFGIRKAAWLKDLPRLVDYEWPVTTR